MKPSIRLETESSDIWEVCKQQSPLEQQNYSQQVLVHCCSLVLVRSRSCQGCALLPGSVSGYGAVSSTRPAPGLLLLPQTHLLSLAFTLPQPWGLEDLLDELLKGTLDAIFGLCTGLCTKERAAARLMRSVEIQPCTLQKVKEHVKLLKAEQITASTKILKISMCWLKYEVWNDFI